ncbi:putative toxin-antitoxin system toxin component, PIN family [Algoriphagus sp. H41]|uniref:Toxin-antitoxin system toxin component, PIN family n=1 Tax=Algoriphagus oliviformis TaxID=2811231 RepID=A0ABS3C6J6_9BACT|nr:putative toxin-antitoxin system toxin component, PIN family [Algoriphagus oliviformis]MBN7811224.1 putative toxin-antitoxin system toxin component, PIN family [Algoriphagus oliviformis]
MKSENVKVIFDTNVWISFLIGRRLTSIKTRISGGDITIVIDQQLIDEIRQVTSREKIRRYFPEASVNELIDLLETIALRIENHPKHFLCRDPKDNFLLDLIDFSKADYLVTGDQDLLELNPFLTAKILTPSEFEKLF